MGCDDLGKDCRSGNAREMTGMITEYIGPGGLSHERCITCRDLPLAIASFGLINRFIAILFRRLKFSLLMIGNIFHPMSYFACLAKPVTLCFMHSSHRLTCIMLPCAALSNTNHSCHACF